MGCTGSKEKKDNRPTRDVNPYATAYTPKKPATPTADPAPAPASGGGAPPSTAIATAPSTPGSSPRDVAGDGEKKIFGTTPAMAAEYGVRKEPVTNFYTMGKELGRGGFSVVVQAKKLATNEDYAIKCISKENMEGEAEITLLLREVSIMKQINHPNVLKLYEVFEDDEKFYLVMELVTGKELFDKIVERGQYSEKDAAAIVRQIIDAVAYLHKIGIAHRDLKPENLLSAVGADGLEVIKIVDFGFSKNFGEEKLKTSCGSPGYVAPEVLTNEDYDSSVDMWSVGVIIYILLCGYPPFYAENAPALFKKIMEVKYDFNDPSWDDVSPDAKDLITHLLVKSPQKRWTAAQCLDHPWVQGSTAKATSMANQLKSLKEYNSKRNLGQM